MRKFLFFLVLSFSFISGIRATHIVGGEMNYKYLGGWNYEVRLTVYRDCWVGVPPFDQPACLGIFDINNNLVDTFMMQFLGLDTLAPTINDPCFIPPTDFCYEVTTYIDTFYLPPIPGGYQLVYQRCCRNQNILNIQVPQSTGATYYATIPDTSDFLINSNPVFKNWPPPFICAGKLLSFDHSAIDYDGDSLVYELFNPFEGATTIDPMPQPPNNPPYLNVVYISPYSVNDMLGGSQPMSINSSTGLLTAIPSTLGYFVIGVKVKEYRNGVLVSETKRDFQFIVKDCPAVVVAAAYVPSVYCGSNTVSFSNSSVGASSYSWYFGDPSTTADSSNQYSPSYTYPGTGSYSVTMVAYAPNNPACNDSVTTSLSISDNFAGTFTYTVEPCDKYRYAFNGAVVAPPGTVAHFNWNFGDGTSIDGDAGLPVTGSGNTSGTYDDPIHVYPSGAGNYTITLTVTIPGSSTCNSVSAGSFLIGGNSNLFVPNTFTPNNDGKNDIFRVKGAAFGKFYFAVYNRWGQLMFETNDPTDGWDGTFKGAPADGGVFGWYLKASCAEGEPEEFMKGNVTLIR
jgi:gliding motility-associated-like protein